MAKDDKKKDKSTPKKDTNKNVPKVTPSKDKGQNNVKDKARSLIKNHPQVLTNARGLFRNENGKTIVEEIVHRGDSSTKERIMPRNQCDLTDEDLRSLAVHASTLVNKDIAKYDPVLASEEALAMSIRTKDGGKYDGKVNANTFCLILGDMKNMKKASDESKENESTNEDASPEEEPQKETGFERGKRITKEKLEEIKKKNQEKSQKAKEEAQKAEDIKNPEEGKMDKETLRREKEAMLRKLSAIEELMGEEVEAADEEPTEDDAQVNDSSNPAEPDQGGGEISDISDVTASLDKIAGVLEQQRDKELFKMAFQLDQISDILEGKREASALESDPDEKYMKNFFKGGLHDGDSDESYMKEFNTDITKEVESVKDKKNGKEASQKLPYQKLS